MDWTRPPDGIPGRNETEGFARRALKNLEFVQEAHLRGEDVHVVTQLTCSLLAMVVFPLERLDPSAWSPSLAELERKGWPRWTDEASDYHPATLGELVRVLRHAIAHANIDFSSDSRYLDEVTISFVNRPPRGGREWRGSLRGDELSDFCGLYLQYMWNWSA